MKPDDRFPAVGSDTGQFGVALDLDAPALVIGQVPVKPVDLVQGEDVNKFFDICSREEMTCGVEHGSPVGEPWFVTDFDGRNAVSVNQLSEALEP